MCIISGRTQIQINSVINLKLLTGWTKAAEGGGYGWLLFAGM